MKKAEVEWSQLMSEQRQLKKQGISLLYQRIKLLIECYNNKGFLSHCVERGVNDIDVLDSELEDIAVGFLTMKAVFESYPKEEDWQRHSIRDLIAEVLNSQKRERDKSDKLSWKERALAAERECERLRAELDAIKESLRIVSTANMS